MDCPTCAQGGIRARLTVRDTRHDRTTRHIERRRVCDHDPTHQLRTIERPQTLQLDRVRVFHVTGGVAGDRFSRARLAEDLRTAVLGRLSEGELEAIVNDVCATLQEALEMKAIPTPQAEAGDDPAAVPDEEIVLAVERRLSTSTNGAARILFALATRGRITHRTGFKHAEDFLRWLSGEAAAPAGAPRAMRRPLDLWWPPSYRAPMPESVVSASGAAEPFVERRLVKTVEHAFMGRWDAEERSHLVAQWVLWSLAGQRKVLTAQLASGVMDCLRRVDDIAYLRYTASAKRFTSEEEFVSEARGLLMSPSPRLRFQQAHAVRPLPPPHGPGTQPVDEAGGRPAAGRVSGVRGET